MASKIIHITEEMHTSPLYGDMYNKIRSIIWNAKEQEHREEISKRFWQSLSENELESIIEEPEVSIVIALLMQSIFKSENPAELKAIFDDDTIRDETGGVILIAGFEYALRNGEIFSDDGYFYNPYAEEEDVHFVTLENIADLEGNTPEDRFKRLF